MCKRIHASSNNRGGIVMSNGTMKAYRLFELGKQPELVVVEIPEPKTGEVLIKMAAAGLCRSDLESIDHGVPMLPWSGPYTLGHENAGYIEKLGEGVTEFKVGDPVIAHCQSSCGHCEYCLTGKDNFCENLGSRGCWGKQDGGWAQYMIAPARELVALGELDPTDYVPIADAGVTPYNAVRNALPKIPGNGVIAVCGVGGLGFFAVQFLSALTAARIIVLDVNEDRMEEMKQYGADDCVKSDANAAENILKLTDGKGVNAFFDFVGINPTLKTAVQVTKKNGVVSLIGLGGGSVPFGWADVKPGVELVISNGGTLQDLREIIALARRGKITMQIQKYPFSQAFEALDDLRQGKVQGRAVLTFDEFK